MRPVLCHTPAVRLPEPLRPGDLVAVVAPSSPAPRGELLAGLAWLAQRYRVRVRADVLSREGYLAGSDARRAAELASALVDPEVRAVFCARGGYGLTRVLEGLPWAAFERSPRWLVGFSDITALHLEAQRRGVVSLHAANVTGLGRATPLERARLMALLERGAGEVWSDLESVHAPSGVARARGPAVGGNLTMLATQAAAGRLALPSGAVLFLEDVTERPYRLDRMLTSLRASGALSGLSAVVLGDFTECAPGPDGVTVEAVLAERTAALGVPVVAGAPFGHGTRNRPIPLGFTAVLEGPTLELRAPG
ncbi:MAG TPA: LD-carboxypeptidase [Polyangiaceae bacterium]|nr:LD-carboxypeptidase [Polyangiaceae bacterium]